MDHDRGAKPCLVGEDAALKSPCDGTLDGKPGSGAAHSPESKGKGEDRAEHFTDLSDIDDEHDQSAQYVSACHERHELLRDLCDALDAADDDKPGEYHEQQPDDQRVEVDPGSADDDHAVERVDLEHGGDVAGDGVHLAHVSDAERGEDTEDGEQHGEHLSDRVTALFGAKTVSQVVHGAAAPLIVAVFAAVIDAEHIFGIVCHHAEKGGEPHPEDRTGSSGGDGGSDTCDVADTDGCGERGAQRLELGYGSLFLRAGDTASLPEHAADGLCAHMAGMCDLEKPGPHSEIDPRADDQDQHRDPPHHAVDGAIDVCYQFKHKNSSFTR